MKNTRLPVGLGTLGVLLVFPLMAAGHDHPVMEAGNAHPVSVIRAMRTSGLTEPIPTDPEEIYKRQCVACHGSGGKGDGPAAPAFNPRPANLTDTEFMQGRTDAELREVLEVGKGSMPAFGRVLDPADIDSLVVYLRELGDGG